MFVISCTKTTLASKKIVEIVILMRSNVYDEVTDFEVWIHQKLKNLNILRTNHCFFFKWKNQSLHIEACMGQSMQEWTK